MNTQIAITRRDVMHGVTTSALMGAFPQGSPAQSQSISAAEARAIAKDAYIYGFPLVDSYRIQYAYFVDRGNPEYKGAWNTIASVVGFLRPMTRRSRRRIRTHRIRLLVPTCVPNR